MTTNRFPEASPIGEEQLAKSLGGGKVLHYAVTARQETIVVSKLAQLRITIIIGQQGSGKTSLALAMARAYKPDEQAYYNYGWLIGGESLVPPYTKVVVIDDFPQTGNVGLLLSRLGTLAIHVIACVQIDFGRYEDISLLYSQRLGIHPIEYINTGQQSAS